MSREQAFWKAIGTASLVSLIVSIQGIGSNVFSIILLLLSLIVLARFLYIVSKRKFSVDLLMGVAGLST